MKQREEEGLELTEREKWLRVRGSGIMSNKHTSSNDILIFMDSALPSLEIEMCSKVIMHSTPFNR